jgi:predicted ferric reductase
VYIALAAALLHQVTVGTDLLRNPWLRVAWVAAVLGVLVAAVAFRVVLPVVRSLGTGIQVAALVQESPRVWSLLLRGERLAARVGEGGAFCWVRVLRRGMWTQAHPFSVSGIDADGLVRVTFAADGDFTAALTSVPSGTRVILEGPYGRFRASVARTRGPYLLVGVGSGVGAVVGVLGSLPVDEGAAPPVLVQRVRSADDVLVAVELQRLIGAGLLVHHLVTGPRECAGRRLDDPDGLRLLVPDVAAREVYVCGPAELTARIVGALRACGVPRRLVHTERFALGGRRVAAPSPHPSAGTRVRPAVPARPRP